GFDYRFNSLYRDTPHPFVVAMLGYLEAAQLPIQRKLPKRARRLKADQQLMLETVQHIIEDRRAAGTAGTVNDLLDRMLTGLDRQSGEKLDDANIIAQCITFLIAGHETTSGLLSFALHALLKNPGVLARAYDEVDRVLGTDLNVLPTYAQVHQLPYVDQILKETLRLWPTAPAFTRHPYEDTIIGGKYRLEKTGIAMILTPMLHRDKQVWGENAEEFDPDHFDPERWAKIPPNAFLPFGTGQRACIGRQFAMQEAILVMGMVLQRFEFIDFANYKLETKQALTVKPDNFHIKLKLRTGRATKPPLMIAQPAPVPQPALALPLSASAPQTRLLGVYGSNLGTAEGLAHGIADEARNRGFVATVEALDDHVGSLPKDGGLIIVAASYNGQPPDNAAN